METGMQQINESFVSVYNVTGDRINKLKTSTKPLNETLDALSKVNAEFKELRLFLKGK
ncbi:MAG: hypothetical protein H6765_06080 [Candidatus Peribacteria bacterium]|nr:MAG: hypothetical protein H6765_06080 [Candidatus Peribacteria bacterium]